MPQNFSLGRGLSSLIPKKTTNDSVVAENNHNAIDPMIANARILEISPNNIKPNPRQPRHEFSHSDMQDLINSIKEHGILQPLLVTRLADGNYELIAGERRLRASQMIGLERVPVMVRTASDLEKLELALIENLQRSDLNPVEEAEGYKDLMEGFGLTQEEVAKKVGKSRAQIANMLRMLKLPTEIQKAIADGVVTFGHAKVILSAEDPKEQIKIFKRIIKDELTVAESSDEASKTVQVRNHTRIMSPESVIWEDKRKKLESYLGTKVKIKRQGKGGEIVIDFYSEEEFYDLFNKLSL